MAVEKSKDRLEVLERIEQYEKEGRWSEDVEKDPPTIPLLPDQVDYLEKKPINWLLMKFVNTMARNHIKKLLKQKAFIMEPTEGLEKFIPLKDKGAIITCNHFNAFDNFAVYKALEPYIRKRQLYKVCREGNFTNFPGIYGLFFRHCNTLPLSQNASTMKKFMEAVEVLLNRGEKILIYAEQGMWWNYRKPRPVTPGSYRFAVKYNVPIIPLFISLNDNELIGNDGFPVQEYTVHVLDPIYPDPSKSAKENVKEMMDNNYRQWKAKYEEVYGIPLTYSCSPDKIPLTE